MRTRPDAIRIVLVLFMAFALTAGCKSKSGGDEASGTEEKSAESGGDEGASETGESAEEAADESQAAEETGDDAEGPMGMMAQMKSTCPMMVDGVSIETADTDDGVAVTFTTEKGDVKDLRGRVEHMAEMYEMHGGQRGMMWHGMGGHMMGKEAGKMGKEVGKMGKEVGKMGKMAGKMGEQGAKMGEMGAKMGEKAENMGEQAEKMGEQAEKMGKMAEKMGKQGQMMGKKGQMMGKKGHMMGKEARKMAMKGHMMGGMGKMPAATASVEEVDGGAKLVLTPKDAADLDALREGTKAHMGRMQGGECPMLMPEEVDEAEEAEEAEEADE